MLAKLVISTIAFFFSLLSYASCLNERISLKCTPCTIEQALEKLESQINCTFSYSTDQLDPEQEVNVVFSNELLTNILASLTNNEFGIRERGTYILMIKKKVSQTEKSSKKDYVIEGYVKSSITGQTIEKATIYSVGGKYSTITNNDGYYSLHVSSDRDMLGLSFSKRSFLDTIIVVKPDDIKLRQDILLTPRESAPDKMPTLSATTNPYKDVEELAMVKILVPEKQRARAINLNFLEDIPIQLSLIPSIGTNRFTSGMKTNTVSFNVLAGYNAAIEGVELGGLVNITRTNMTGFQAAGLGNIVGGEVKGLQTAGVFNNVRGSISGAQFAGLYNIVLDTIQGVQAAGFLNVLRGSITGAQLAGFVNVATENMSGLQAAGFANVTQKEVKFGQVAGFWNQAGTVTGLQIAGFANNSLGKVEGIQIAGFGNHAQELVGSQVAGFINTSGDASSQIAGFINVAKTVSGTQIGFINVSDSSNLSIGFLSFSLRGYNHLDLNADLVHPINVSYRMGSKLFYNIIQVGYGSYFGIKTWSYGYGIGLELGKKEKRLHVNLELSTRQIFDPLKQTQPLFLDNKFEPSLSFRLGKKRPSIVLGPSFHLLVSTGTLQNQDPEKGKTLEYVQSFPNIYNNPEGRVTLDLWTGIKLGVRI
jgi:hypothetical protein